MATRRDALKGIVAACGFAAVPSSCRAQVSPVRARYWEASGDFVRCGLCPHECSLESGQIGKCRGRRNDNGEMVTLGYGRPCAVHVDPIEKKPLYHCLPGAKAYSMAVAGCNFRCLNCQNWTISQVSPLDTRNEDLPPRAAVAEARRTGCRTIAYTYSEPSVWFEYMFDTSALAREAGLRNVWVTNGYLAHQPLEELAKVMDAANIDLKAFDEKVHLRLSSGKLEPVLRTLALAQKLGIWVEITNLVIPQWTDNPDMIRRMCIWIRENMGTDVPLHFSRFHPGHRLTNLPPTPAEVLVAAARIAREEKLSYVYVGNVAEVDSNTYCPACGARVVERRGYLIGAVALKDGKCAKCGKKIAGIWS